MQFDATVPTVADRVAQTVVAMELEKVVEPKFHRSSYGYRPGRSPLDAVEVMPAAVFGRTTGCWIVTSPGSWSHRHTANAFMGVVSKRAVSACGTSIRRPFRRPLRTWIASSSPRLTRCNTVWRETPRIRIASTIGTYPGGASSTNRARSWSLTRIRHGRAGCVLFAGDEPVAQHAVQRGGRDAEDVGRAADREQLSVGRVFGGLVGGDAAVAAQAADDDRGEPLAARGAATLAVEDPGDRRVVVVDSEPLEQRDRVLFGADARLVTRQRNDELGDRAATPAQGDRRAVLLADHVEDDFLDQRAQQLFAVPVGRRRRGPNTPKVGAEREQSFALGRGEGARALVLAQLKLGLRGVKRGERVLPVAFQPARDEAVLGLDLAVASLRTVGVVLGALDLQPPLLERLIVVLFERFGGHAARPSRRLG